MKGIRRRNPIENKSIISEVESPSKEVAEFNSSLIDKIIQRSIELKLQNVNQENKNSVPRKSIEEDGEEPIGEKQRSRSKGISKELFKF